MSDKTLQIEVDGQKLPARPGQMLIELTDANDIYIPRFCYHRKLSVAANCRMCLVEVENAPKPLPACATPVADGMKVATRSKLAIEAQKSVMEFLLINHPLDCPICDQGGECELQDIAMGYGSDVSRYQEAKRVVQDKNIGPLIHTDMTRCIHCTRCVRFGEEIAGLREMGATGRGEHMEIGTYIEKSLVSELSGNIIDICPVGALTSKPFRYSARSWEMVQRNAIAPHDSVGSNVELHIKDDRIMRVVPALNESVNEVWLSDRDRFSYEALYDPERLQAPMIKDGVHWRCVPWAEAFEFIGEGLGRVLQSHGAGQLGGLASPAIVLEELYLFQKLLRALGSNNIDHRLRQVDFRQQEADPVSPSLGVAIADLEELDAVLLIGSNVRKEQPMINHRLRKASLKGADIMVVNSVDYEFNYHVSGKIIKPPADIPNVLLALIKALAGLRGDPVDENVGKLIKKVPVDDSIRLMAEKLSAAKNGLLLLGNLAVAHNQFSILKALAQVIAEMGGIKSGFLGESVNSSGACLAGVLPHRAVAGKAVNNAGLDANAMLHKSLPAYLLLGVEPELDCWDGQQALNAMRAAEFVVSMTGYESEAMKQYADVLLPIALFAETSGTYVNIEGRPQAFIEAVSPAGSSRPVWKILRVLAGLLEVEGFDYNSHEDVRLDTYAAIGDFFSSETGDSGSWLVQNTDSIDNKDALQRVSDVPMYRVDAMVRRARSLQQADKGRDFIQINAALAKELKVSNGDLLLKEQQGHAYSVPVMISDKVPDNCVFIPSANVLDHCSWHGAVDLRKA